MKASVKFREEKNPLLRVKFPHLVAGFPLSSGIAVGDSQDLALSLGTSFEAGPCLKVACRPNSFTSPLSLVLKTGIGTWGSPNAAELAITAELILLGKGGPVFSMHLKPRRGDFSLRKRAKSVSHSLTTFITESRSCDVQCQDIELNAETPLKLEKTALFTPVPSKFSFNKGHSNGTSDTSAVERVENWGNDSDKNFESINSIKTEGLDQGVRGKAGMKPNSDGFREHESDSGSPTATFVGAGPDDVVHEIGRRHSESFPVPRRVGIDGIFRGWSVLAHSTMPVGKEAELNVQWGLKVHSDTMPGLESSMSSLRLPYLSIQKITIATGNKLAQTSNRLKSIPGSVQSEQLQPLATSEEIRELSHVAALCGSTKRHLHLLYAENEVLKTAMEQMKSEFELRGSAKTGRPAGTVNDVRVGGNIVPGPNLLDDPHRSIGPANNMGETEEMKHPRDDTSKHQGENNDGSSKSLRRSLDGLDLPKERGNLAALGSNGKSLSSTKKSLLD